MNFSKISAFYRQTAVVLFNTFLLFLVINLVAGYLLHQRTPVKQKRVKSLNSSEWIIYPAQKAKHLDNPDNLLYRVYPGQDADGIRRIFRQAKMTDHPVYSSMVHPGDYGEYRIGKEGIRFDDFVTAGNIDSLINGSVWLLGGSTMYGYCMAQSETISNYLNLLDNDQVYLNFGTPGHMQSVELKKLILLLKKGYRPAKVIFLDGNNDLLSLTASNFHPADTPDRPTMAQPLKNRRRIINDKKLKGINLQGLPILRLLRSSSSKDQSAFFKEQPPHELLSLPYATLGDSSSLYHRDPDLYFKANRALSCDQMSFYPHKIAEHYRINQDLIDHLAYAYDFEYQVIFQPLGFLHPQNPFIKDFEQYRSEYACFELLQITQQAIRDSIAAGSLPNFYDFTQTAEGCEDCYVDLVHYSGPFNKRLAEMILALPN